MLPSIFLQIYKKQGNYALISGKLIFGTFPFLRFLKDSATIEEWMIFFIHYIHKTFFIIFILIFI